MDSEALRDRDRLVHLLAWAAALAMAATVVQVAVDMLGWRFDLRDQAGEGRSVMLFLAGAGVLMVLWNERRRLDGFGLSISEHWPPLYFSMVAAGALCCALSYYVAVKMGLMTFVEVPWYRWPSAAFTACLAFLFAPLQEIIFRSYLLTVARDKIGMWPAILVVSLIYALTIQLHWDYVTFAPQYRTLLASAFLAGMLLSMMRFYHGSILAPTGAITGWVFVQILMQRSKAIAAAHEPVAFGWLCPPGNLCWDTDPLRNPIIIAVLTVTAVGYGVLLRRNGERTAPATGSSNRDVPLSFKKYLPFSSLALLAPLDVWLGRLIQARLSVGLLYLPRLLVTLAMSAINTVVSLPERLLLPLLLRRRQVRDPVFILGVHRSGTTHLHNLLSLDPQFVAPKTYQVMNPIGFLVSGWLFVPFLWFFVPWKRPMDAVELSLFTPQEDEYAIAHSSRLSPYWGATFPREGEHYDRYIFPERFNAREREEWKAKLLLFLRKLCLLNGKRPLLKNPYNTARAEMLCELFPGAKFVHIYRNPYTVYRSNVNLARQAFTLMQVQDQPSRTGKDYAARFLDSYAAIEEHYYAAAARLPADQSVEVRFEDLEADPIGEVERVYRQLGMTVSPEFRERLRRYVTSIADYRKNTFKPLPEDLRQAVQAKLAPLFERWGYPAR